jgi:hypothetical protein
MTVETLVVVGVVVLDTVDDALVPFSPLPDCSKDWP